MDYKTALQSAILSQDVYQNFAAIQFRDWIGEKPVLIEEKSTDTQMAILEDLGQKLAIVVFRGSDSNADWGINTDVEQDIYEWSRKEKKEYAEQMEEVTEMVADEKELIYPDSYSQASNPVKMHRGFTRAYLSVRDRIHTHVQNSIQNSSATTYRLVGHSLGGAIATLCAVDLQYNFSPQISVEAYSFGSPRVGNREFVDSYNRRVPNTWRVVNGWDAVVGLPAPWQGYRHVDTAVKLERKFTWRIITGSFEDHRLNNYVKALRSKIED